MRNALAPAKQRTAVAAMLKTIFAQETKAEAEAQWEVVADALREKQPRLGALMDGSRDDVLAYMSFPREHWTQIASTNGTQDNTQTAQTLTVAIRERRGTLSALAQASMATTHAG